MYIITWNFSEILDDGRLCRSVSVSSELKKDESESVELHILQRAVIVTEE